MPEIKNNFTRGIMNKDLDERLVPNGQYRHAQNIEVLTGEGGDVGVVKAILGNVKVDNVDLSNENFVCVGSVSDDKRNRIIYLISGETKDIIVEYNTENGNTDLVAVDTKKQQGEGSFLNFGKKLITGINIIDDFLFFTDNRSEPKKINIAVFKQGTVDVNHHTVFVREGFNTGIPVDESFATVIKKKPLTAPRYKINPSTTPNTKTVFEKIFPRFAIRYKYQDGEYSAIGPFTDVAFNPVYKDNVDVNNYYDKQGGYNKAMQNGIESIAIYDFNPKHMPKDVVQVDLLYKQENSTVVYVVESFVRGQDEFTASGSAREVWADAWANDNNNVSFSNGREDKGVYIITSDKIKSALPENQLLRNFDVAPKKALAQEVIGNRVVYGNYSYGYDIPSTQKPTMTAQLEQRSSQNLSVGGVKSVKSQRDYQLGLVYGDKYGRETPVFTSPLANTKTSFADSVYSNMLSASVTSQVPSWVDYYKFYVKETSSEYHNVVINKAYAPVTYDEFENEEGHIWFALNSFDVNKIDEESHIIFKKIFKPSGNSPFPVENRYKVLAISQDVPEAIKYKHNTLLDVYNDNNQLAGAAGVGLFTDAIARIDYSGQDTIVLSTSEVISNYGVELSEGLFTENSDSSIYISWKDQNNQKSKKYKVTEVNKLTNEHVLKLASVITDTDATLASVSGTASSQSANLAANLTFVIEKRVEREAEEFSGRFFIKVEPDENTVSNLLNMSADALAEFAISATSFTHYLAVSPNTTNAHHESNVNYNTSYFGSAPDETPDDVVGTTFIGTTENHWQSLVDNTDAESRFFLDGMTFVAQQASPNNYAAFATHGYLGNYVSLNQLNWLGEAWEYEYPTLNLSNVNNGGTSYITGQWVSSIGNTLQTGYNTYKHTPDTNGGLTNTHAGVILSTTDYVQRIANGLEPFVVSDDIYTGQNATTANQEAMRRWRELSNDGVAVVSTTEMDETYGAPGTTGKIFMHLSFLAPGKDLHDNTWTDSTGLNTTYINGPNAIGRDMQGIWGGGAFSPPDHGAGYFGEEWQISSQIFERSLGNAVEFEGNYDSTPDNSVGIDHFETRIFVGDDYFPILPAAPGPGIATAIGYDSNYEELHNRQWDPTFTDQGDPGGSIQEFIDKIVQGAKFRFTEDTSQTEYTILSVTTKKLYNHTPWRSRKVWNGTSLVDDANAVEEKAQAWAKSWVENGQTDASTVTKANALKDQIVKFGKANNRRLVYVIELDANPADNTNFNPVAGGSGETDANTPARIEFIGTSQEIIPGTITSNSAIAEVEPKQQEGLDIYYEASDVIPIRLDENNVTSFAPIGSRVEFINLPESINGERNVTDPIYIRQITFVQAVNELLLNLRPSSNSDLSFNWRDAAGIDVNYNNSLLKIIRPDGSYTIARITTVEPHSSYYNTIGSRVLFKLDRNVDPSLQVGLSWNNCYSFGDGVESNSVRDEFSEMKILNGAKASTTIEEEYKEEERKNGLIYSGIYNSNNSVNNTNQFIAAEKITKDINPTYGSIQKLFSRNTDLITLCEDRVLKILANKDALFNADSNVNLVATQNVLGQAMPFIGDYGISKNPESFAFDSFRAYFTDKERGAVLRLSMDGLTPISDAGMQDYFKDNLRNFTKLLGTYDIDKEEYNLTLTQLTPESLLDNGSFGLGNAASLVTLSDQIVTDSIINNGSAVTPPSNTVQESYDTNQMLANNYFDHSVTITDHAPIQAGSTVPYSPAVPAVAAVNASYSLDSPSNGGLNLYSWQGYQTDTDYDPNTGIGNDPFGASGASSGSQDSVLKVHGNSFNLQGAVGQGGAFTYPPPAVYLGGPTFTDGSSAAFLVAAANIWYQGTPPTNVYLGTFPATTQDWWYYEDAIVFYKVNGHGGNPNTYLQVPGDPASGSWSTTHVTAAQQSVYPSATRMSVFAGEEITITLNSTHLGTGSNSNKWKVVICDGDIPVSNDIIYDPGEVAGAEPYGSTMLNASDLTETPPNLLGHQATNECAWPGAGVTGFVNNKWWRAKWKFKSANQSEATLSTNSAAMLQDPTNAEVVINNLTIRLYKSDNAGDDTQILKYVRIRKSVRLQTVGVTPVAAVPEVLAEPAVDIPGWKEVSFGSTPDWTLNPNAGVSGSFTYGAEQIYGPENPGTTITASNGQTYLNGSDNGVANYGDPNFPAGTFTVGSSSGLATDSVVNFYSITSSGSGSSVYLNQDISANPYVLGNWYLVDVYYDAADPGTDQTNILVPGVVPYAVQNGPDGALNSSLALEDTAYGTDHLDNHPLYPRGYYGLISGSNQVNWAKSLVLQNITPDEYLDYGQSPTFGLRKRAIFQYNDQSYWGGMATLSGAGTYQSNGDQKFRLQSYGQDFNIFGVNLVDITTDTSGGELTDWYSPFWNLFKPVHLLDYWRGYYNNGGFNYRIEAGDAHDITGNSWYMAQALNNPQPNTDGYKLKIEVANSDDTGTVENNFYARVGNGMSGGVFKGVVLSGVDLAGTYEVDFNFDNSTPVITSKPTGSNAIAQTIADATISGFTSQTSPGHSNKVIIVPYKDVGFTGKITQFSVTEQTQIISSGASSFDWDFYDFDTSTGLAALSDIASINYDTVNEELAIDNPNNNIAISQNVGNLESGSTYTISFDFDFATWNQNESLFIRYYNNGFDGFTEGIDLSDYNGSGTFSTSVTIGQNQITTTSIGYILETLQLVIPNGAIGTIDNISLVEEIFSLGGGTTVVYNEQGKGWTSFRDFVPEAGVSCSGNYYTLKSGNLYEHYAPGSLHNSWYGSGPKQSSIKFLINAEPSIVKTFNSINYEGSRAYALATSPSMQQSEYYYDNFHDSTQQGWILDTIRTDIATAKVAEFVKKENKYFGAIIGNSNTNLMSLLDTGKFNVIGLGNYTSWSLDVESGDNLNLEETGPPPPPGDSGSDTETQDNP